ncbi:MAG: aminotransferase class I/II-fold pyridoxal phosphate-dependent enzyme, partial [bacterium]
MLDRSRPDPVPRLGGITAYDPPRASCPTDLQLDVNEGRIPASDLLSLLTGHGADCLRRYPDRRSLEAALAARLEMPPSSVLVTAGADDALDRICRAYLDSDRSLVVGVPTFEMIPRYARLTGARVLDVPWPGGDYPVAAVLARVADDTSVIAVVTPNNPTGAVAGADDLRRLSDSAPQTILLVDLAYGEFADEDLTPVVRELPNAVGVRSFSKAWGLAGLRVGYAFGPERLIAPLRAAGGPYAVSGPSLLLAEKSLDDQQAVRVFVDSTRRVRSILSEDLRSLNVEPLPSQANFVYARFAAARWVRDGLAGLGIAVRLFAAAEGEAGHLRITCPAEGKTCDRLRQGLRTVLAPEAVLLDLDGVLADVRLSYHRCIVETARSFGLDPSPNEVTAVSQKPGHNNDWVKTRELLARHGKFVDLATITTRFQAIYADLANHETLIPGRELLVRLAARYPLAIVTGQPSREAEGFLQRFAIAHLFTTTICLEDGPEKPDPAGVRNALDRLGVRAAWMVGDTVNDIIAARQAGVVPLGIVP